ncbi:acyltransferase family protein [Vibrio splendidus]
MKRIEIVDYARLLAAFFVLLYHYTFNGFNNGKIEVFELWNNDIVDVTKYGYLGVHFFFMISGFVIGYSVINTTPRKFILSRMARLYPAYWIAIVFTSVISIFLANDAMSVSLSQVIVNLTMLQHFLGVAHIDGVYWTLSVEILFYGLIFVFIITGAKKNIDLFFIVWSLILLLSYLFGFDNKLFLGGYFNFFCAGGLFSILVKKFSFRFLFFLLIQLWLCVRFSLREAETISEIKSIMLEPMVITSVIVLFFVFFILISIDKVAKISLPKSKYVGAITYPLYLIHAHVGYMFINFFGNWFNFGYSFTFSLLSVFFLSNVIYYISDVRFYSSFRLLFKSILYSRKLEKLLIRFNLSHW